MTELFNLIKQNLNLALAITAIIAVCISFISILLTFLSLSIQRIHNLKSVKPIGIIDLSDYENFISVRIRNSGIGPLIITRLLAKDKEGQTAPNIISLMPDLSEGFYWDTYFENIENFSIIPSQSLTLLKFSVDMNDTDFNNQRDSLRRRLSEIELTLEYKDIYGRKMPKIWKDMKWFARHFADLKKKETPKKRIESS